MPDVGKETLHPREATACTHLQPPSWAAPPPPRDEDRAALEEAARTRGDEDLDRAVTDELESLAREEAWEQRNAPPPDPTAPKLKVRTDKAPDGRHLVVGLHKRTVGLDEFRIEVHKRMGR